MKTLTLSQREFETLSSHLKKYIESESNNIRQRMGKAGFSLADTIADISQQVLDVAILDDILKQLKQWTTQTSSSHSTL